MRFFFLKLLLRSNVVTSNCLLICEKVLYRDLYGDIYYRLSVRRESIENAQQKLWLTVYETTNSKQRSVANVTKFCSTRFI